MPSVARPRPARRQALIWAAALGLSLLVHGLLLLRSPSSSSLPAGAVGKTAITAAPGAMRTRPLAAAIEPSKTPEPLHPAAPRPTRIAPIRSEAAVEVSIEAAPTAPATIAIAPPTDWLYRLSQNGRQGLARLSWQPQAEDGGYTLSLERELDGRALPGWRSQGRLDAQQGLSPQRYALQGRGREGQPPRDRQAINFRRDEGLISFSASAELHALPMGVQDRLSAWLQLAALLAGAPQRYGPGSEIRLTVAGLRGEPREQVFEVVGEEALALPQRVLAAVLHLRRLPLGPYDGGLELWLDPARGHLPVRVLAGNTAENGGGWEMQLLEDSPAP